MTGSERALKEQVSELLSGDRHKIIQMILGHPSRLPTVEELAYMTGIDETDIESSLGELIEAGIVDAYRLEGRQSRGVPSTFYGCTPDGVRVLDEFSYLDGMPVMRALYDKTRKTDQIERLELTPRPELPTVVRNALIFEETGR